MRQGTTPTHTFEIPFEKALIKNAKVVYSQNEEIIFSKGMDECNIEDGKISVKLTQQDTFLFKPKTNVYIQLRILTQNDDALVSEEIVTSVARCLDDEVLE